MRGFLSLDKIMVFLAGAALLLATGTPAGGAGGVALKPVTLKVGFIQSSFFGFNPRDAEAAFKTFARTIGRSKGYDVAVTVQLFDSARELDAMPAGEQPELIILESWNYLELKNPGWLEPVFLTSDHGQVAKRFLLLTGDPGLKSLADLRGRSLNVFLVANTQLGPHWLQVLLQERKLGPPEAFFGLMEKQTEPMRAVLPVFFGNRDAVLIDSAKLDLMAELNPQLKRLKVLESSEPLVSTVICAGKSGWSSAAFRKDLFESLATLHLSPAGQQILDIFRIKGLIPFEDHFLDTVRKLREKSFSRGKMAEGEPADG
jgi:ABC-type phosphate/phosphonate transport system substrate-binding protein